MTIRLRPPTSLHKLDEDERMGGSGPSSLLATFDTPALRPGSVMGRVSEMAIARYSRG